MITNSTPEVAAEHKPKRRVGRFLLRALLALIVIAIAAHFTWKSAGSNQWKKVGERKGVVIYSMKSPGSSIEKFKAVWTIHSRLSKFVMWVSDTSNDKSKGSMRSRTGLYDLKILESQGERVRWSAWKQPLAKFLMTREFVIRTELSQDPQTRVLLYTVKAVPDRIPPNECCVRIQTMDNSWTLTPLKDGDIHVEWFCNMDLGGAVPYALQNTFQPYGMLQFAPGVEHFLEREKYRDAKYDWIQD